GEPTSVTRQTLLDRLPLLVSPNGRRASRLDEGRTPRHLCGGVSESLLAYLLLHRNAPQDRSRLAFLLWPDSTEVQAHTNLRKLLYQLRQSLPDADHFIHADNHSLQWLPALPASQEGCTDASWTLDILEVEQ